MGDLNLADFVRGGGDWSPHRENLLKSQSPEMGGASGTIGLCGELIDCFWGSNFEIQKS